ncbi:MAG: LytTR family DNA-binding domain-containing protein [Bacteroidota bacterium]
MPTIKCLIADDEPYARQLITDYVQRVPFLEVVTICRDAWEVAEQLEKESIDLLLLDIEMPEWDGISLLKTYESAPQAILITAHRDYAVQAFDLEVVDYLLKPVSFERFLKAIYRFRKQHPSNFEQSSHSENSALFLKQNRQMVRVDFSDIRYLEVMGDYVKVVLKEGNPVVSKTTLKEVLSKLPEEGFLQIHRSFVVAKSEVEAITADKVKVDDQWLAVSRPFRGQVRQMWNG